MHQKLLTAYYQMTCIVDINCLQLTSTLKRTQHFRRNGFLITFFPSAKFTMNSYTILTFSFATVLFCQCAGYRPFTVRDHALAAANGPLMLDGLDWYGCFQECLTRDPECISYNFCTGGDTSWCELNSCGLNSECDINDNLLVSPGCVFQQIRPVHVSRLNLGFHIIPRQWTLAFKYIFPVYIITCFRKMEAVLEL